MAIDPQTEQELIQEAVAGDRAALQGLLLAHYREIENIVRRRFNSELAAHLEVEDVVQDVLVDVHRGISHFKDGDSGNFNAWLQRIAENRVIDTVRHFRRLKRTGASHADGALHGQSRESLDSVWEWLSAAQSSPDRNLRRKEAREMAQICLAGLNEDQRHAVSAFYFEHKDACEIGNELNRSPAAVRELLRRARKRLAELFGTASAWLSSR